MPIYLLLTFKDTLFSDLGQEVEIPKTENDYELIKYNEVLNNVKQGS